MGKKSTKDSRPEKDLKYTVSDLSRPAERDTMDTVTRVLYLAIAFSGMAIIAGALSLVFLDKLDADSLVPLLIATVALACLALASLSPHRIRALSVAFKAARKAVRKTGK